MPMPSESADFRPIGAGRQYDDTIGGSDIEWVQDPTSHALFASSHVSGDLSSHPPFCLEVGRRLVLAQLQVNEWVLRRVERAEFGQDRSVSRHISLDFNIPRNAPKFRDNDSSCLRLVPLSIMRRRTLVNLAIRTEDGSAVVTPGLRFTQQLEQSMLLAAAASVVGPWRIPEVAQSAIRELVTGRIDVVISAYNTMQAWHNTGDGELKELISDGLFRSLVARTRRNFTMFVFLDEKKGRHRVLRMAFDEPTGWEYKTAIIKTSGARDAVYEKEPAAAKRSRLAATLGWRPTKIRLETPGAARAASYHFEFQAPPGVQVVSATLLAGRPNEPESERASVDRIVGHAPVIGLHAIEVPTASLCRVEIELQVPLRGWLTTMLVAVTAVAVVMSSVALHRHQANNRTWTDFNYVADLIVLLVAVSAGVVTLVAQRDFGGVAARLTSGVRILATISTGIPAVAAGFIVYGAARSPTVVEFDRWCTYVLFVLAFAVALPIAYAWNVVRRAERHKQIEESPWDMTAPDGAGERSPIPRSWEDATQRYFLGPAIDVESAEGWQDHFTWTDTAQQATVERLKQSVWLTPTADKDSACTIAGAGCWARGGCPAEA